MAKNTVIVSVLADTKQFSKGFQDSTSVLGRVASLGKGVIKTAAGVTAAVVGMAAAGGFARALKLDEARTQLRALGYDGQTMQGIMNSALTSVKGTAFGLDAAATIAAQALASGIQPGQQLTASLTTVANTAALAKTDMGEMGSIFAKVWANGKVTTMEMNQLADRGVPIWQYLGKSFNVSNAELRKMIEAGEVTADMFMNSLGPAVDGMATRMSGGFKGMAMNAFAALSRVGAMFAGPLLDSAKGFLGEATTLTDGLGTRLQPVADRWAAFLGSFNTSGLAAGMLAFLDKIIATIPGVVQFVTTFSPLSLLFQALQPVFPQLAAALGTLGQVLASGLVALGPALVDVLGALLTLTAQIVPPVAALAVGVIQATAAVVSWVIANRDWLSGLAIAGGVIGGVVATVGALKAVQAGYAAATYGATAATYASGVAAKAGAAAYALQNSALAKSVIAYAANTRAVLTNNALSTSSKVAIIASSVATGVATAAQWAWNAAMSANPIGLIVTAIGALVAGLVWFFTQTKLGQQIWGEFTRFLTEAWNNIVTTAQTVFGALGDFFGTVWNGIVAVIQPVVEFIGGLIKFNIEAWQNVFIIFAAVLKTIWDGISAVVMAVWQAIVDFLTPIVQGISNAITIMVLGVQSVWNSVWGAISAFFTGIWNGIVGFLTPIIAAVASGISGPLSTIQGIWNSVWSAISSFFTSVWNGIVGGVTGAVGNVVGVVSSIYGRVVGAVSGAGRWLIDAGRNVVEGFWNGISGMAGWLQSQVTGFFDGVIGWAKGVLNIKSPSRVFMEIGGFVGKGLANGITSTSALVKSTTERLAGTVIDSFDANLDGGLSVSIASPTARQAGAVYNITINGGIQTSAEIGRAVTESIRAYEAAGGRA